MSLFNLKIGVIVVTAIGVVLAFAFSSTPSSTAKNDDILAEIAGYRSWTKINKAPIRARINLQVDDPPAFTVEGPGG